MIYAPRCDSASDGNRISEVKWRLAPTWGTKKSLQGFKQQRPARQMRRLARPPHQTEPLTVRRTVRHAQIGGTFGQLPFCRLKGIGAPAVRLKLPAHNPGPRKPASQRCNDFWRRQQFNQQFALLRGNFICALDFGKFAGLVRRENLVQR